MRETSIFISFPYDDPDAVAVRKLVRETATRLRRVSIVDGSTLDLRSDFSGNISSFIREHADCVVAILLGTTENVANVTFEAGVAVGANKDVVPVTDSPGRIIAMLKAHDAVVFHRESIEWQVEFSSRLEQKLRNVLLLPDDHQVEEKLSRRYLDEETHRLKNATVVKTAMEIIRAGDLVQARAILNNLIEGDPRNIDALYLLGDVLYLIGCKNDHPDERQRYFELQLRTADRALSIDSHFVLALNVKSNAEVRLGRLDEARSTLTQIASTDPDFSVSTYNLACLHAMLGRRDSAISDLRSAISKNAVWREQAKSDPDFASLRTDAEWKNLIYQFKDH